MSKQNQNPLGGPLTMAVDYGPLVIFFLAYRIAGGGVEGAFPATLAFMVAITVAIIVGLVVLKRVSPMTWLSAILILIFGGVTLYLHDVRFIQMKPTIIYVLLGTLLVVGLMLRKAFLRWIFGPIFQGLDDEGWLKLSRNWAIFFFACAAANEVMRRTLDFDTWLTLKVWGMTILSMVFAAANIPMLVRHGLDTGKAKDAVERTPVE